MQTITIRKGGRTAIWLGAALLVAIVALLIAHGGKRSLIEWFGGRPGSPRGGAQVTERPVETPPPLPGGDSSVSPDPKALLLVGTKIGARPEEALAFLGVERRNPQTYRVGSLLPNGSRIAVIGVDHVILQRDGKTLRLNVSRDTTLAQREPPVRSGALDSVGGPTPRSPPPATSSEAVTTVIRPSPVFDDTGQFVAYALQPGADAAAFARLGLRPGDRLVNVNGVALADVSEAARALQMLTTGATLTATVQRGGQPITVRLDGQVLSQATSSASAVEAPE